MVSFTVEFPSGDGYAAKRFYRTWEEIERDAVHTQPRERYDMSRDTVQRYITYTLIIDQHGDLAPPEIQAAWRAPRVNRLPTLGSPVYRESASDAPAPHVVATMHYQCVRITRELEA